MLEYKNLRAGHYSIAGKTYHFRSGFEHRWGCVLQLCMRFPQLAQAILQYEVTSWQYEPETLPFDNPQLYDAKHLAPRRRGILQYKPDFKVTRPDGTFIYHETKGYMAGPDATKLRQFHRYYPGRHVLVVVDGMPRGNTAKSAASRRQYDFLAKLGYEVLDARPILKSLAGWLEKLHRKVCFSENRSFE